MKIKREKLRSTSSYFSFLIGLVVLFFSANIETDDKIGMTIKVLLIMASLLLAVIAALAIFNERFLRNEKLNKVMMITLLSYQSVIQVGALTLLVFVMVTPELKSLSIIMIVMELILLIPFSLLVIYFLFKRGSKDAAFISSKETKRASKKILALHQVEDEDNDEKQ